MREDVELLVPDRLENQVRHLLGRDAAGLDGVAQSFLMLQVGGGFLAIFAPGGVGVREGALIAILQFQPGIDTRQAVAAAFLLRLVGLGAEVVVDGAQSMGVLDDPVKSLQCDYYGMSAHKWLGTPVGMGVLWMRPEHTSKVWPLVPPPPGVTGMKRYEWIGTAPAYIEPAARPAIALHQTLGAQRKAARLRYLASHLRTRVGQTLPQARFYNTGEPGMSINLTTIELPGVDSDAVQRELRQRHSILVQSMAGNQRAPEIRGFRVSPNVYTTPSELDRFVTALAAVVESL